MDTGSLSRKCLALTGGIATGKSVVADMLKERGAHIIDTDLIAREVVEPGMPALEEIVREFGTDMLMPDGTLDREQMREEIISDSEKREKLNSITHPRINSVVFERITALKEKDDGMPVIIDVPLLYEAGWDRFFPDVILVYVPVEVQAERLMKRDHLDRDTAMLTISAQMGIEEKKEKAVHLIDNSGTLAETEEQVDKLFPLLQEKIAESG
jgi:dephospho-CoA kinase